MRHSIRLQRAMLGAAAVLLFQHGAAAWAQDGGEVAPLAGSRPSPASLEPLPAGAAAPLAADEQARADASQGDVATLMQLIRDGQVVELRATYNGSFGARLFFYPHDLTWYVTLFQNTHFWRVIRSQDEARAQAIYTDFAGQTERLSEVEIRRTQLEAQKAYLDRAIALSEGHAQRLLADLDVARTQRALVDDRQRQMRAEATALQAEKARSQAQLQILRRQVQILQRATEIGLPGPSK